MKINKFTRRKRRHFKIRKIVIGTLERPRLNIYVSNKHFYVQIINDETHNTLVSFSTMNFKEKVNNNKKTAEKIGKKLAELALFKKIKKVVFDRGGFLFHGKIKVFSEAARKEGLNF